MLCTVANIAHLRRDGSLYQDAMETVFCHLSNRLLPTSSD
jgi:hypothetical protein